MTSGIVNWLFYGSDYGYAVPNAIQTKGSLTLSYKLRGRVPTNVD